MLALPMRQETTMFDLCLGMAVLYFKEKNCDFVVLETGLGGAKDSTAWDYQLFLRFVRLQISDMIIRQFLEIP